VIIKQNRDGKGAAKPLGKQRPPRKPASPIFFPLFFAVVMLLFCGILVYAYHESQVANPIMLDEQGHIR